MYIVRVNRGRAGEPPVHLWLRSIKPVRWGDRDQALKFATKSEARRGAEAVKAVGWTIENA